MKLPQSLANRLAEVLTEGKWVTGTNFKAEIVDLSWQEATQKIASFNSIADLTFHVSYYIAGVAKALEEGTLDISDKYSFDYPPITSEEDWQKLINKFCTDSERLIAWVKQMEEKDLYQPFFEERYGDYQRNINVIIEHTYYHFGQVILLKKMIKVQET